jgi:lipopolysaccharide/colanic/teichoic acid biosynthesis glycosyltransferase
MLHIDEFPQFWNLLKGDVSFVGPRPEFPSLAAEYATRIPYYHARHLVKPGLAGWARLYHEEAHHRAAVANAKEKLAYDLYYISRRSLLLDFYIILQTVRFLILARGA